MDSGMGFALSHMAKCGWKEGKGLGREETGMKEAIKVKLKFDSTGFGHDRAEEFTFQWWDHVFNKAAENISVSKNEKGAIELQRKEELIVSKSRPSVTAASMKEKLYGSFVKGGTLHGSEEVSTADSSDDESDEDNEPRDMSMKLSDDQLFKLCGGRTAHKGARHGLNMNAKLERIRLQEEELMRKWKDDEEATQDSSKHKRAASNEAKDSQEDYLIKMKNKIKGPGSDLFINSEYEEQINYGKITCDNEMNSEKKKKKNKKNKKSNDDILNDSITNCNSEQDVSITKKMKKKKHKAFEETFSEAEYAETLKKRKRTGDESTVVKKKVKTLIDQDTLTDSGIENVEQEIKENGKNSMKKKNKEGNEGIQDCESKLHTKEFEYGIENHEQCKKKKKKSKKNDHVIDKVTSTICFENPDIIVKKKKKKNTKTKEVDANAGLNDNSNGLDLDENDILCTQIKEKKKKKKNKNKQLVCNTIEEVEVKIQKKKKSKKSKEKN